MLSTFREIIKSINKTEKEYNKNNKGVCSNDFRKLQEESRTMSNKELLHYRNGSKRLNPEEL
jgi:hypothetical protein